MVGDRLGLVLLSRFWFYSFESKAWVSEYERSRLVIRKSILNSLFKGFVWIFFGWSYLEDIDSCLFMDNMQKSSLL